jgi:hypothetical protein
VVFANSILVLYLSSIGLSAVSYGSTTKWLFVCLIFTPTLNDNDVCYNLFANVENILYSHTMIVLLICYRDTNNKEQIYMKMAQIY